MTLPGLGLQSCVAGLQVAKLHLAGMIHQVVQDLQQREVARLLAAKSLGSLGTAKAS